MAETCSFDVNEDLVGFWGWDWDVIVDFVGFVVGVDLDCFHCCFWCRRTMCECICECMGGINFIVERKEGSFIWFQDL